MNSPARLDPRSAEAAPSPAPRHPTVAVVVPLYNHAAYIVEALASVLAQDSPCDEIVVLDDGSRDAGFELASRELAGLPWARVLRQDNAGAHLTINRAIAMTSADYIAVLNSDDAFLPGKIGRCRRILGEDREVDLVFGAVQLMGADSRTLSAGPAFDWLQRAAAFLAQTGLLQLSLLNENYAATTSNMVFSRRLWLAAGGFQNLRYCHDLDFLMYAFGAGAVRFDAGHDHIRYRVHSGNTIGEDLERIRVELASVIAESLHSHGGRLLGENPTREKVDGFCAFLANKRMTDLLCLFQTLRGGCSDRAAFYALAAEPGLLPGFRDALARQA